MHNQKHTLTNRENNEKDDIEDKFSDGSPHKDLLVLRNQNFSSGPHSSNTVTEAEQKENWINNIILCIF